MLRLCLITKPLFNPFAGQILAFLCGEFKAHYELFKKLLFLAFWRGIFFHHSTNSITLRKMLCGLFGTKNPKLWESLTQNRFSAFMKNFSLRPSAVQTIKLKAISRSQSYKIAIALLELTCSLVFSFRNKTPSSTTASPFVLFRSYFSVRTFVIANK